MKKEKEKQIDINTKHYNVLFMIREYAMYVQYISALCMESKQPDNRYFPYMNG